MRIHENTVARSRRVAHRPAETESSKVLYPEEFWHDQAPTDIVGQSDEKTCLDRTRSWVKNSHFPRIVDAWKLSYAQIRTQQFQRSFTARVRDIDA